MVVDPMPVSRSRVRVRGLVQGVGYRPFVHELAGRYGLTGWVLNDTDGVLLEVQGQDPAGFLDALASRAPPLAQVDRIEVEALSPKPAESGFEIRDSVAAGPARTMIGPDAAVCPDCLAELFDPGARRWRYPFVNCTHCGPRHTITRSLPYDRPQTSMAGFPLCPDCAQEYADPNDRRFHAQPIACPVCGPRLHIRVEEIVARLRAGEIVAIKGLGGFHLACDAGNPGTVTRLRALKQRNGKPFAMMVASLAEARRIAEIGSAEAALLTGPERPVVLVRPRSGTAAPPIAPDLAPDLAWLGLMLPYTPLHYLLFHEAAGRPAGTAWLDAPQGFALVMTSANPGGEPLVIGNAEAAERLGDIADCIVTHDRDIVARSDDSVARVIGGAPMLIRRARGYVPLGIPLGRPVPPVLALGGHLKNTVCVTRGSQAFLSQHLGDLENAATLRFFEETIAHLLDILEVEPVAVAHDLHPDFLSTRHAESLDLPCIPVQHHHAHVAAVAAEYGRSGPMVGLALDGFGLGDDGDSRGGELLLVDGARCDRLGHLAPLAQPGGDAAARQPWRMAAAALHRLGRRDEIAHRFARFGNPALLVQMLEQGFNCPPTTSCGRWFDAACGLLGVRTMSGFEGEAAMVLESLVTRPAVLPGGWTIDGGVLDLMPLLDALRGLPPAAGADLFHGTLAAALVDWALPAVEGAEIALSGGCVMNAVLTEGLIEGFARHGVTALVPRRVPANDGGLSLGQAWVAAHHLIR
ncbi:carbamoyltransferase HypF [Skermanella mucosa]|uniref:carbamoyltransferase HypF n=1 Tax=Skermanella mucosa TaxID=1789672 RepID=UPI001E65B210|nr:carbamoyltransferase HypF [Skermanella mucosa]UEM19393.1 carbamoyltransferase HypF [Skermanella mucosa]